jgi:uncharacterized radical SAM superfamily Fe-S cluster-containing enzyme
MDEVIERMIGTLNRFRLPVMIVLDITNVCNLRCVHCPHADIQKRPDFKPRHLQWAHFTKIVDELSSNGDPCLLRFVGDGEPLLHPKLVQMVEHAKQRSKCIVNLTTNGTLLFPDVADRLLRSNPDLIDVSLDALTEPVYRRVRRGGSYETVMRNLFHLLDIRKKKGSRAKVMVSFIEQDDNCSETDLFRKFWTPLVDYVMVRSLHSASGKVKREESRSRNESSGSRRYPCPHLWKRLTIDFHGRIKFCAHDWESGSVLGAIEETTLEQVWKGDELAALRSAHLLGEISDESICKDCTDWASSKWDWGYERLVDKVVIGKPTLLPCLPLLS